jgi:hypothetical protein
MANIKSAPERIAQLEKRVTALEKHLSGKLPPDVCRCCGERALRLDSCCSAEPNGNVEEHWKCSLCNGREVRVSRPRKGR